MGKKKIFLFLLIDIKEMSASHTADIMLS